jgi:hypothetical protein
MPNGALPAGVVVSMPRKPRISLRWRRRDPVAQPARSVITKSAAKASAGTDLSRLSITEIVIFHTAARASADAWMAISNQPRSQGEPILSLLDGERQRSCGVAASAMYELRARHPPNWEEPKRAPNASCNMPATGLIGRRPRESCPRRQSLQAPGATLGH